MRASVSVISPTSVKLQFNFMSQVFGNEVREEGKPWYIGIPTSSVNYVQVVQVKYTVDTSGIINVTDINLNFITKNFSNANCRLQISGDGGNLWIDVTDDIPGDGSNDFVRKGSGQWLSNINIGTDMLQVRILARSVDGNATTAQFRADSTISIIYNKIYTGTILDEPSFPPTIGRGFVSGGRDGTGTNIGTTERFNDITNAWTSRTSLTTARRALSGYSFSMTDFGFTSGGFTAAAVGTTERFDDIANTQTAATDVTARSSLAAFSISLPLKPLPDSYGYTSCGTTTGNVAQSVGTTERYDNVANTQTGRTDATSRTFPTGYSMFGAGFTSCGIAADGTFLGTTERLNDITNAWTTRTVATTARFGPAGYSIVELGIGPYPDQHPFGFTSGGATAVALGTTERFDDNTNAHTTRTSIPTHYRLAGFSMLGYGFTSNGFLDGSVRDGATQRLDDISNVQTTRTADPVPRDSPAGYSLEELFITYPPPTTVGHGFTSCGVINVDPNILTTVVGTTERFDDTANTQTSRANATARRNLAGYSFSSSGFTSCGISTSNVGTTERFNDTANAHTIRTSATARRRLTGYSFNNLGFTSCGFTTIAVGTTERFDDTANTQTSRTDATARFNLAGYAFNNFGFTSCGAIVGVVGTTERFDDTANAHTTRADATARNLLTGYSFNNLGFTSCGVTADNVGTTERFDDTTNTQTSRADAYARSTLAGYSFSSLGFTSCGTVSFFVGVTQKFDDTANVHTLRAYAVARSNLTGYNI